MFTCIMCKKSLTVDKHSIEHVFPKALGGRLILDDMCRLCNNDLGTRVDSKLTNHFFAVYQRFLLGLRSHSNKEPNPFALGKTVDDRGVPVTVHVLNRHITHIAIQTHIVTTVDERGGLTGYSITMDPSNQAKIPDIIRGIEKRHPGLTFVASDPIVETRVPLLNQTVTISENDVIPAMLKIAYEVGYLALGSPYLDDPTAQKIRTLLTKRELATADIAEQAIRGSAGLVNHQAPPSPLPISDDRLVAAFVMIPGVAAVEVNIFNTFEGKVVVSTDTDRYPPMGVLEGPLFVEDVKEKTSLRTTILQWLQDLAHKERKD